MARLRWAVACYRIITDQPTNSISYIDTVEAWSVPALGAPLGPFLVGTVWEREERGERITHRLRIVDPQGDDVGVVNGELVHPQALRHRANISVMVRHVNVTGSFQMYVEQRVGEQWRTEAAIPLEVSVEPELEEG